MTPHPRQPLLKRFAVWTAAVVLSLAVYLAGAPFVIMFIQLRWRPLMPMSDVVYKPVWWYLQRRDLIGSLQYRDYFNWCLIWMRENCPANF